MAQIKQRDLFVRRLSIYRVRIWRKDFEVDFKFTSRPMQDSMHVRECTTVLESGLHAVDFQIPVLDSSSCFKLELGFRIPIVCGIPDSLSWIPDSKTQNSIPQAKLPSPTWCDSSNTRHASEVKALCITAHCYTCSQDTDATYVAVVDYESTWLYKLIKWFEYLREGIYLWGGQRCRSLIVRVKRLVTAV